MGPTIVALHLCPASRAPLIAVERVSALHDQGLEGDRHAKAGSHRQVLLIERETLDQFGLRPGDVREQVTVQGIDLNALAAGTRLSAGTAVLEVAGPCTPCERMNALRPGLMDALQGRRGRFVRVAEPGSFAVGDVLMAG